MIIKCWYDEISNVWELANYYKVFYNQIMIIHIICYKWSNDENENKSWLLIGLMMGIDVTPSAQLIRCINKYTHYFTVTYRYDTNTVIYAYGSALYTLTISLSPLCIMNPYSYVIVIILYVSLQYIDWHLSNNIRTCNDIVIHITLFLTGLSGPWGYLAAHRWIR